VQILIVQSDQVEYAFLSVKGPNLTDYSPPEAGCLAGSAARETLPGFRAAAEACSYVSVQSRSSPLCATSCRFFGHPSVAASVRESAALTGGFQAVTAMGRPVRALPGRRPLPPCQRTAVTAPTPP